MSIGLSGNGLLISPGTIQTPEERKANMYVELERLKNRWENKNKTELPEVKTYEKKEYKEEDADKIKAQVEEEFKGATESGILNLQTKNDSQKSKIKTKMEEQNASLDIAKEQIKDDYSKSKADVLSRAIEQGIARSSIVGAEQDRLSEEERAVMRVLEEENALKNSAYEVELALLEKELEAAMQEFQIEQAVKIKKRINDLTSDVKKENEKILEYNNKMAELEQKSINARADAIEDAKAREKELEAEEARYGYTGDKKLNYDQRMNVAKNYYMSLSRDEALKQFEADTALHEYLGLYYDDLRTILLGRKK